MDKLVINNDEFFGRVISLLEEGKEVTIPVKGFSMLPFIRGEKDLVILRKPDRDLSVDDIVLFRYGGRYVMHRIIAMEGGKIVIRGDGVLQNTERVTRADICALATKVLRRGKRAVDPYSPCQRRKIRLWQRLLPVRGYLLAIYRRLPWNWFWLRRQFRQQSDINRQLDNDNQICQFQKHGRP